MQGIHLDTRGISSPDHLTPHPEPRRRDPGAPPSNLGQDPSHLGIVGAAPSDKGGRTSGSHLSHPGMDPSRPEIGGAAPPDRGGRTLGSHPSHPRRRVAETRERTVHESRGVGTGLAKPGIAHEDGGWKRNRTPSTRSSSTPSAPSWPSPRRKNHRLRRQGTQGNL